MTNQLHYPDLQVCVLAAGKGKRMRSNKPKVLHHVLGRAMVDYVLHTIEDLRPKGIALVTGHASEQVQEHVGNPQNLEWVIQDKQLGTGHAVQQCEEVICDVRDVLIVCGDTPLLRSQTLATLVDTHRGSDNDITVLTAELANPYGYGRVVRNHDGNISGIVEQKDATSEQQQISEVSSGIYCVKFDVLFKLLHQVENRNAQGEYYLPDIVPIGLKDGFSVGACYLRDVHEMQGVNDRAQLSQAESFLQKRIIADWQAEGVTIEQPETVRIEASVKIGIDTLIKPGSQLSGSTHIGDGCVVGPYAVLEDAWIEDGCMIEAFTHVNGASVGAASQIGPFARLRPEAKLDEKVKVGNFVEIKKSVLGRGSKVNHLSYVGDTEMGSDCNIGAGTITCNYDGANKHQTLLGNNVFVGSDTKLIAPVKVGDNATIGAGSIITRAVAEGGLTLSARPEQRHIMDWKRPSKKD